MQNHWLQVFRNYISVELEFTFSKPKRRYTTTCSSLFGAQASTLSFCRVGSWETLSHGKMCILLPTVSPNGCLQRAFNERKQQERLYSKTETDGANKVLLVLLAQLLTVPSPGNERTCHMSPSCLCCVLCWRPSTDVVTNETDPKLETNRETFSLLVCSLMTWREVWFAL